MPISEVQFTSADNPKGIAKLKNALSFTKKIYAGMGDMTFAKICLLEGNKFRTGLWTRLQMMAPVLGLRVEQIIDNRPTRVGTETFKAPTLRDYQEVAVVEVLKHPMGVLCAATGAGKTHMAAAMIARKACRTLFLVHTKDLLYQAKNKLEELLGAKVGVIGDGEFDLRPVTVATVQTLSRNIKQGLLDAIRGKFDMLVQDETHHIPASTFYEVSGHFNCCYVYGLSATPYRADGADLMIEAAAGPIMAKVTASDLIARGVLSKPIIRFVSIGGPTSHSAAPRFAIIRKYIVENEGRNKAIAEFARQGAADGKTVLVAVKQVKHGDNIKKFLPEAETLYGNADAATRKRELDKVRSKKTKVMISTLLSEGVDLPSLDVVINAAGGTDTIQLVGRVLRKAEGKTGALIVDFVDNDHIALQRNSFARIKKLQKEDQFTIIRG